MNKDAEKDARSLRDVKGGLEFFKAIFEGTGIWSFGSGSRYESRVDPSWHGEFLRMQLRGDRAQN
jgi:hypothetical protein